MPFYCKNTFNNIFPIIIKFINKNKMGCNTLSMYIQCLGAIFQNIT